MLKQLYLHVSLRIHLLLWKSSSNISSYMECLHSISLVVLKGLRSLNGLFSFVCLVFSFFYVNLNSFLLLKGFLWFRVNLISI